MANSADPGRMPHPAVSDLCIYTLFTQAYLSDYGKCPSFKYFMSLFLAKILLFMQLFLKILTGMVNSVDSDQTAPSGAV